MLSKKANLLSFIFSVIIMLAAPFVAVRIINGEFGFAFVLIQLMCINPVVSAINGIVAGKKIKSNWSIVFFPPALFLISARIVFGAAMAEFLMMSLLYLGIGAVAMGLTALIVLLTKKKKAPAPDDESDTSVYLAIPQEAGEPDSIVPDPDDSGSEE